MTVHDLGYVVSPDGYQYLAQDFLGLSPHVEIRLVQRNIDNQIYQIVNTPDGIEVFRNENGEKEVRFLRCYFSDVSQFARNARELSLLYGIAPDIIKILENNENDIAKFHSIIIDLKNNHSKKLRRFSNGEKFSSDELRDMIYEVIGPNLYDRFGIEIMPKQFVDRLAVFLSARSARSKAGSWY